MTGKSILDDTTINWLLSGDISLQYQVNRYLLHRDRPDLRGRIETEGWGARFLEQRREDGHWGRAYYQPKWTSTHYTLMDLRGLEISPEQPEIRESLGMVLDNHKAPDGGIDPSVTIRKGEMCLNGMILNCASYFQMPDEDLRSIVDFILSGHMQDGGFNCNFNRSGAVHSSLHTTISVLEGIHEYARNGYRYRVSELQAAEETSQEFILQHRLFRSDHTGEIIDRRMLLLSYPPRWKYDILRALDYFRAAGAGYDARMQDAIEVLLKKRRRDGTWPLQGRHPGQTHFEMEQTGKPSRWNTLRASRVIEHFDVQGSPTRSFS